MSNVEKRPAGIQVIDPSDAKDKLAQVYESIGAKKGPVANILKVQSLHPEGLQKHSEFYRTIMFGASPLSRAEREAVAVVVSWANACHY